MRERLATIQKVLDVRPIEGADKIEAITILGWHLVAKKDEFNEGDLAVFIEVDSILPEKDWSEFMRPRKFRVKTAKFMKMISQGLALPLNILPPKEFKKLGFIKVSPPYEEGEDVTELLGIVHYETLTPEEKDVDRTKRSKLGRFFMRFAWYRKYFVKSFKGGFPQFLHKTDEERLQNNPRFLEYKKPVYITEKLDGQSGTFFIRKKSPLNNVFGVCSRNIYQKTKCNSNYWKIAKQFDLEKKLKEAQKFYNADIAIQGEIVGDGIQKNKYGIKGLDFYVFNVFDINKQEYFPCVDMMTFCSIYELKTVPIICFDTILPDSVDEMVEESKAMSVINSQVKREGIVVRSTDGKKLSFKVINPEFLLKWNE
jgi:uncharacterized membrane protein